MTRRHSILFVKNTRTETIDETQEMTATSETSGTFYRSENENGPTLGTSDKKGLFRLLLRLSLTTILLCLTKNSLV